VGSWHTSLRPDSRWRKLRERPLRATRSVLKPGHANVVPTGRSWLTSSESVPEIHGNPVLRSSGRQYIALSAFRNSPGLSSCRPQLSAVSSQRDLPGAGLRRQQSLLSPSITFWRLASSFSPASRQRSSDVPSPMMRIASPSPRVRWTRFPRRVPRKRPMAAPEQGRRVHDRIVSDAEKR